MNLPTKQWIGVNIIPIISVAIIIGAAIYSVSFYSLKSEQLDVFENSKVVLVGEVVRDPDIRDKTIRLTVKPEKIDDVMIYHNKSKILVSIDRFNKVAYGDIIEVNGTIRKPDSFETDSGRTFNYPKYLETHGISHEMPFSNIKVLSSGNGNPIITFLLSIKHTLIKGLEISLPEPFSALAGGLLLGEKQSLGDKLSEAFRNAGVVHIIVLSGYNVALVINSVLFITLRTMPRLFGYGVAGIFVIGFAILTGGSETTIRATIMALLMMTARILNRPAAALRGLFIAAAIMALWNPNVVLYDLSFQLSVVATLGLIIFSDKIARKVKFVPELFGLREITSTTIATQITVLPLLIFSIGAVSVVFLPANILVLPMVPLAMLLSFIASIISLLVPFVALPFIYAAYLSLAYIINISDFFGTLPFASIKIPLEHMGAVLIFISVIYILVFTYIMTRTLKK